MALIRKWVTFGIDLGTTYSAIAWLDQTGHIEVLPNRNGDLTTASAVLFEGGDAVVGGEALQEAVMHPDRVAEGFKRDMGSAAYAKTVCGRRERPEKLSALVLKKLKQDAEVRSGVPIKDVVVGVPAFFDDGRRKATQDAGKIAGLNVFALINEPTAAAIYYGYLKREQLRGERIILVYDLGGGTFDATLMRITGGKQFQFETLVTDGDVKLGGKDWDERIINYVAEEFRRQTGADPRNDLASLQDLALCAEKAKRTLSTRVAVEVPVSHAGRRLGIRLDRAKLKEISGDLLARSKVTLELLVKTANLEWSQVDTILAVGGSSRMTMVQEMLTEVCGRPPDHGLEEDLVVAKGAALYAAAGDTGFIPEDKTGGYIGRVSDRGEEARRREEDRQRKDAFASMQQVNAHSLGVVSLSRGDRRLINATVIPKNTPIPAKMSRTFSLVSAGLQAINIRILEGEAPTPGGCIELGTCRITNLPAGLPKGEPVEVTFEYSKFGRVQVKAQVRRSTASVEIDRPEGLKEVQVNNLADQVCAIQVA